jgi:octopine/nopaline transport system permease protein
MNALLQMPALLQGALVTLELLVLSLLAGGVLALLLALARLSALRPVAEAARFYIFLFRSTPLLVQIFLIYYGLGQFDWVRTSVAWPLLREPMGCAVLALALNNAAYAAEILRGAIRSVAAGQIEAARALGMSRFLLFRRIVLAQALRNALPAYGNEIVQMIQATALASTITLVEITGAARAIAARTFQPVEIFLAAGALYLLLTFAASQSVRLLEKRFRR